MALTVAGVLWTLLLVLWIIPSFGNETYGETCQYLKRYAYLGRTLPEIVSNIFSQPGLVIQHLFVPMKVEFVLHLLVPLAFVPLIGGGVSALALPIMGYLLLADHPFQNSIRFHYTATLLPFVFFGGVVGLERLSRWHMSSSSSALATRKIGLAVLVGTASLTNYFFQSAGPLGRHFDPENYSRTAHTALGYEFMSKIPAGAPVLADAGFVPHLSQRPIAYQASIEYPPKVRQVEYILADTSLPIHRDFPIIWQDILASPYFETIAAQDGYLLKRRVEPRAAHPLHFQFDDRITLLGYTLVPDERARRGETTRIILEWRAERDIRDRYVIFVHLVDARDQIWAQDDREPANGWLRTDRWNAGDFTPDAYTLELPSAMPPGKYRLTVGLYNVANQQRLRARDSADRDLGDEPTIVTLCVE